MCGESIISTTDKIIEITESKFDEYEFINSLSLDAQFIALINSAGNSIVATDFIEVSSEEVMNLEVQKTSNSDLFFAGGYIGVLAYDHNIDDSKSRFFKIAQALVFDNKQKKIFHYLDTATESLKGINSNIMSTILEPESLDMVSHSTNDEYIKTVERCIKDILNGYYYQINILKYFTFVQKPTRKQWLAKLKDNNEPFSVYCNVNNLELVSFSPERFCKIKSKSSKTRVIAVEPIKGTIASVSSKHKDELNKELLLSSSKDLAELHMIVDLLRNDLNKISKSNTVKVVEQNKLKTFKNLHHLVAKIESEQQEGISLKHIIKALFPSGSITGAPKKAAMEHIKKYETRKREFFMGSVFYYSFSGHFDSSVLIRTAFSLNNKDFQYAAGSGLVVKSDAISESAEVDLKCKVVMNKKSVVSSKKYM